MHHVASKASAFQAHQATQRQRDRVPEPRSNASPFAALLSGNDEAAPPPRNKSTRTNESLEPRPHEARRPRHSDENCASEAPNDIAETETTETKQPETTGQSDQMAAAQTEPENVAEAPDEAKADPTSNAMAPIEVPLTVVEQPPPPPATTETTVTAPAAIPAETGAADAAPATTPPAAANIIPPAAAANMADVAGAPAARANPAWGPAAQGDETSAADARSRNQAIGLPALDRLQQLAEQTNPGEAVQQEMAHAASNETPDGLPPAAPPSKSHVEPRPVTATLATTSATPNAASPDVAAAESSDGSDAQHTAPADEASAPPSTPPANAHANDKEPAERPQVGSVVSDFVQSAKPNPDSNHLAHTQAGREFGQAAAAAAHAAQHADTVRQFATPPVAIESLAVEIATRAHAGNTRFEIRLDPPELGRIDVRLDIDRSGHVTSRLLVERAETLDVLRRDAHQLERALQDAGLKTSDNALQFSLRDQAFADRNGHNKSDNPQGLVADPELPPSEALPVIYGLTLRDGSIDIRV